MRLIDADELQKAFTEECCGCCDCCSHSMTGYKCELIDNAPTVEWTDIELMGYVNGKQITKIKPSKIDGHWIIIKANEEHTDGYECSVCKTTYHTRVPYFSEFNFCPNCGAKMKMAVNLCDDCKFADDCNPTLKSRDGVRTTQCSKYEQR